MPRRDPEKLARARELRANMSPPEWALWRILRAHRLGDIKFSRQVEAGPYYLDFAARRERLAIELDGETHVGREGYDDKRTEWLEGQGWRVVRFTNGDVIGNPDGVATAILNMLRRVV